MKKPRIPRKAHCSVPGCSAPADYAAFLVDDVPRWGPYFEPSQCPYLCHDHAVENEQKATGGLRVDRSWIQYPYTKHNTQGWTHYFDIVNNGFLVKDGASYFPDLAPGTESPRQRKAREAQNDES